MSKELELHQKQKVIFLFINNTDKRLKIIADAVGISMTSVSKILDEFLRNKISYQAGNEIQMKDEENYILIESKMNYDRD